jgi:AsmA protein
MKWVKRLLLAVVLLVVVFFGAAIVLVATIDPNDYKPLIVDEVHKATGRQLTLAGDIELSFFPWLGLRLGAAQLSNAKGFGDSPFASVDEIQVRVALMPLFGGEVRADTVRLNALHVNLSKNKQGVTNWDDLVHTKRSAPVEEKAEKPEPASTAFALAIGGIDIQEAALRWQDAQSGTKVEIAPLNLTTGAIALGEPFALKLELQTITKQPAIEATLMLQGTVTLNPEKQRYTLGDLYLTLEAQGEPLPAGPLKVKLETNVDADLEAQTLRMIPLGIEALSLNLQGQLEARQLLDNPQIKGQLKSQTFLPREVLKRLGVAVPQTADAGALNKAAIDLAFNASASDAALSQLAVTLDDTQITAEGKVASFAKPRIRFSVAVDEIDVDRYLPPKMEPSAAPAPQAPASSGKPSKDDRLALPVDALRALHMNGKLQVGKLKVANLRLSNVEATLSAKDGLVELKPVKTSLYKGQIDGGVKLDARGNTPAFGVMTKLNGIEIGDLAYDLQREKAYLRGISNLGFDLKTRGDRISTLMKQLDGSLDLAVLDGALRDRKLASKIEAVVAFLQNREPVPTGEEILFESLSATANIDKGVLRNDDLQLITALILAKGKGAVDLGDNSIDYELGVALAGAEKDKKRIFVPITVKGPFAKLDYGLDLEKIAKEKLNKEVDKQKKKVEAKVKEEVKEEQEKWQKKLEDKLKDKLKFF